MKVSVLLPTKDRPDRLKRAVAAILAQDHEDLELLIDNGGGPIPTFADDRIIALERPPDIKLGGALLNRLALKASGDVMCVSADDDVMQPGTLTNVAQTFSEFDCEWTYGLIQYVTDGVLGNVDGGFEWDAGLMLCGNRVACPTVFWTRGLFEEVGGFDESMTLVWDYEMWGRFGSFSEPILREHLDYHYEVWDGSASSTKRLEVEEEVRGLHDRWRTIGFGNRSCVMCLKPGTEKFGACEEHFVAARSRAKVV